MNNNSTIIYYSVNTKLAFFINEKFYNNHYVWCSPVFDTHKLDSLNIFKMIPASSNPMTIYKRFNEDVRSSDMHSLNIQKNISGLKYGAIEMLKQGIINDVDFALITLMIDKATIDQFSPLVYLIPKTIVEAKVQVIGVQKTANPLSTEYLISDLKRDEFHVMEFQ